MGAQRALRGLACLCVGAPPRSAHLSDNESPRAAWAAAGGRRSGSSRARDAFRSAPHTPNDDDSPEDGHRQHHHQLQPQAAAAVSGGGKAATKPLRSLWSARGAARYATAAAAVKLRSKRDRRSSSASSGGDDEELSTCALPGTQQRQPQQTQVQAQRRCATAVAAAKQPTDAAALKAAADGGGIMDSGKSGDDSCSLPATEVVFGLACRASVSGRQRLGGDSVASASGVGGGGVARAPAPQAAAAAERVASADAPAACGTELAGRAVVGQQSILRPMASAPLPKGSFSGLRNRLPPSVSMPARLHSGASARTPPAAPSAARLLTNRHAQQQPQPPRGTLQASGAAAGSSALVNRCTSLTASERSYGSSLLSAAFERHDNRRAFTTDSAHVDSASSQSGYSSLAGAAAATSSSSRGGGAGSVLPSMSSSGSASASASSPSSRAAAQATISDGVSPAAVTQPPQHSSDKKQKKQKKHELEQQYVVPADGSEAQALAVARGFSEAFLRALATGDVRWGSDPRVSGLFTEGARMLTHDGQLFVGRTAIIRRLNAGMEQLHRMLGALPVSSPAPSASAASPAPPAGDNSGDVGAAEAPPAVSGGGDAGGATPQAAAERAASAPAAMAAPVNVGQLQSLAAKTHHTLDIAIVPRDAGDGSSSISSRRGLFARLFSIGSSSGSGSGGGGKRGAGQAGKARGDGGGCGSGAGSTVRVRATYEFRFGLRRFRLQDHYAVRGGSIVRLKRTRG
ncbi:hypothetical protein CHLRE_17g709600v5 [Chlamydomonas reinhardtii]|uniref:Uncharacterized protein n=1 Tax=Chlamydomonas reinhardtii TaxID=3055 RepID=A0A2K3CPI5_CHLRE|nr:uncharacterized protein CHLRE_17g709600v5 [Chlamydomonas reinhardtii]PNW70189.1 hypothetical protein CHLRE_17g709600v5 [Chlamydomonas reinhardtii]